MRKIGLTIAGIVLVTFMVSAQERSDTTGMREPSGQYREESGMQGNTETLEGRSGTQGQYSTHWSDQDRENITARDLPSGLLETLESNQYSGWENATIYRNKATQDYMLIIQGNGSPKTFYFDKEGQALNLETDSSAPKISDDNLSQPSSADMRSEDQRNEVDQSNQERSRTDEVPNETTNEDLQLQTTGPAPSTSWRTEDRIIIVADDIPSSLRVTLDEDDQYKGWQNSTLYKNRSTGEYMIEVRDGSNTKVFYFDKDGKVISNSGNND